MAISNRTVTIKNVFASTAETNIPNPPVPGQSYRNTGLTAEEVGQGWPFKEIVDSAKFNEAMYEYTTICQQLEKYGFLPWSANTDYPAGGCALGTDGNVYQAKQPTGPNTTSVDPVTDTSHTYWDLFYYGNVTANRALVSNINGKVSASSTTATEIGYVHGVTSAIQTQLNNKANNNAVVHLAGNETITGHKTFTSNVVRANTNITKGTNPSSRTYCTVEFTDKNGEGTKNRVGSVESTINTNGNIETFIGAYKYDNDSTNMEKISVTYPKTGNPYTYAPSPTDTTTTSGTQIATTGWVNSTGNNVVHKTGDETIAGNKTFSGNVKLTAQPGSPQSGLFISSDYTTYAVSVQNNSITKGTAPSSNSYCSIDFYGTATTNYTNRLGLLEFRYETNKLTSASLCAFKSNAASDSVSARVAVYYPPTGNPYTEAPASDVANSIVTTINKSKAANGYFQLGNGLIIQWGVKSATTDNTTVTLPKAFTTTNYSVCATQQSSSNESRTNIATNTYTTTSFNLFADVYERQQPLHWIAIGY